MHMNSFPEEFRVNADGSASPPTATPAGQAGAPADWPSWLQENTGKLLLFARHQSRNPADAEDLVQEALVESWRRKLGSGPPPLPLVLATIRRRAIDRARSEDRRRLRESEAFPADQPWFDQDPGAGEEQQRLQAAVQALPFARREVVIMKIWGELTFEQIGQVLDIPAATAASRYRYALESMRELLKDEQP